MRHFGANLARTWISRPAPRRVLFLGSSVVPPPGGGAQRLCASEQRWLSARPAPEPSIQSRSGSGLANAQRSDAGWVGSEIDCTAGGSSAGRSWRWHRRSLAIRWSTDERPAQTRAASARARVLSDAVSTLAPVQRAHGRPRGKRPGAGVQKPNQISCVRANRSALDLDRDPGSLDHRPRRSSPRFAGLH